LYYKSFATAVFLDRLLTLRGSLNFRTSNIFAAKAVATSYDNQLWLFDEQDFTLKKIDESGKVLLASNDIRNQIGATPSASAIIDRENVVYVYDNDQGFFLFDYYGAYRKLIPVKGWEFVNVSGNILYGFKEGKLFTYQLDTNVEKQFLLPSAFKNNKVLKAVNGKLYLLKNDGVYVFEIK
jgi:outer membrane protein assembly factor BamB